MTEEERRARAAARQRARYAASREKEAARSRAYREANKEQLAEKQKARREPLLEELAERQRAYYAANREKEATRRRAHREANLEAEVERQRAYYWANREKEVRRAARGVRVRRARERALFVEDVTDGQVWARTGGICHLCLRPTDFDGDWEREHVWPLSWGGVEALDNLAPAHPECNNSKGAWHSQELSAMPWVEQTALDACVKFHLGEVAA